MAASPAFRRPGAVRLEATPGDRRPQVARVERNRCPRCPRSLAYISSESGTREIYIRSVSGAEQKVVSNGGSQNPHWRGDGRELFQTTRTPTSVAAERHNKMTVRAAFRLRGEMCRWANRWTFW